MAQPPADPDSARWQRLAVALVGALVLLELLWELFLAPLRPGGSWLALKALPLALVWLGLARGSRKVWQVTSLLLLPYFAEGVVRALTESGRHAVVAWMVTVLAAAAFVALLRSLRARQA